MSLPAPTLLLHCRRQIPAPAWLPQKLLHHHQEWSRTSPYPWSTSRRYGRRLPAMELDLELVQNACCENDWNKTEAYGVFASSWVKHRWIFVCCDLGQWMSETWCRVIGWSPCCKTEMRMKNEQVSLCLCGSLLSCLGPPRLRYLTVTSWVVSLSAQCTMS